MKLRLFDLHCDSVAAAHDRGLSLISNNVIQLSLDRSYEFELYSQVLAVWSIHGADPEMLWQRAMNLRGFINESIPECRDMSRTDCDGSGDSDKIRDGFSYLFAMEGGEPLCGDISRLETLYESGMRILTPVWSGENLLGGAYDTRTGLTDFGRSVITECFKLGIVPDMSHASDEMIAEALALSAEYNKPLIASHSCSRSVCNHPRNLTDANFIAIVSGGGVAGVNLVPEHLSESKCGIEHVIAHVEHYLGLCGGDGVCLGCDLDGTERLPDGIRGIEDIYTLADKMGQYNYPDAVIDRVFYANGRNFFKRLL